MNISQHKNKDERDERNLYGLNNVQIQILKPAAKAITFLIYLYFFSLVSRNGEAKRYQSLCWLFLVPLLVPFLFVSYFVWVYLSLHPHCKASASLICMQKILWISTSLRLQLIFFIPFSFSTLYFIPKSKASHLCVSCDFSFIYGV